MHVPYTYSLKYMLPRPPADCLGLTQSLIPGPLKFLVMNIS